MNFKRKCKSCNSEYQYEGYANLITFCPNCHKHDFLECEYGYGPVVPCRIYLGSEVIGMVTYFNDGRGPYQLKSKKYHLHVILRQSYLEALLEAKDIIADYL